MHPILHTSYKDLALSVGLKRFMTEQGYTCLEDLLQIPVGELLKKKGFNERSLAELLAFLDKNQLSYLLKP